MHTSKKPWFSVLLLVILLTVVVMAIAEESENPPGPPLDYQHTQSVSARLTISGGKAIAFGEVVPYDHMRTSITVRLQKSTNGSSNWTTIGTWTGSNPHGDAQARGTKAISQGYYYRVRSTGKVYDSSGNVLETVTKTSTVKSY